MARRKTWTTAEDELVRAYIVNGLTAGREVTTLFAELADKIDHPARAIEARWYTYLSQPDERVQVSGYQRKRIAWSTKWFAKDYALFRAMCEVLDVKQNSVVVLGLRAYMERLDDATRHEIEQRCGEMLRELEADE